MIQIGSIDFVQDGLAKMSRKSSKQAGRQILKITIFPENVPKWPSTCAGVAVSP